MRCSLKLRKESFKNYVDKMRVVKNGQLLSTFRMEHVKFEVGGQKREKICPRSYWMTPKKLHQAGKSRYNIAICNECRANKTVWGKREQEAFNNYVDQISPKFDHLLILSGQLWTVLAIKSGLSTDHLRQTESQMALLYTATNKEWVAVLFWTHTKADVYVSKWSQFQKKFINTKTTTNLKKAMKMTWLCTCFLGCFLFQPTTESNRPNSWFRQCCHSTHCIFHPPYLPLLVHSVVVCPHSR